MGNIIPNEHPILKEYCDKMSRIAGSFLTYMDPRDVRDAVEYSASKRFQNFNLKVLNNYTTRSYEMTALDICDYIAKRQPIITSYGVMFKKHEDVPNPMAKVIDSFLKLRKKYKKEMFKYPKGSEMFEKYNLLQLLTKIDTNSIYGLIGLYVSFLHDLNVAPSITSTGRSLISSAILCFESFLGNNVKFASLTEVLVFIDNVRTEYPKWKYYDFDTIGSAGFADVDEVFTKLMMNCGYKYIPTDRDMDTVYKILQGCNQIELNRLFYKNNLYCFMDLPIARDLMVKIITGMKTPYIEPAKPPKEIVPYLDQLRDLLLEYVFYNYQMMDRQDRNKNMIKTVSIVSDTDSSFVSLDAWYHYNIEYLKDYDCPIMHQQIDLFKMLEKEKSKDDYWWKDKETPDWYNSEHKFPAVRFMEVDEYGDLENPHELDAVTFVDPVRDYDFFNDEVVECKRAINPLVIIPQENMKFAIVNVMCYILSSVINQHMIDFTKQSGSYRSDDLCRINMKNEFFMTRILLTDVKKHYASLQKLQEGNYLGASGHADYKGIDCLAKSSISKDTQKALRRIMLEDILTSDEISQIQVIKDVAILENNIYTDLMAGSKKYYKPAIIKSMDNYEDPLRIQGVKAAMAWNHIRCGLPGFDLSDRNPIDIVKIKVTPELVDSLKVDYPEQYARMFEIIDKSGDRIQTEGGTLGSVFKNKLECVAIPKDLAVPDWLKRFIDVESIINDNLSDFPISSIGVSQMDSRGVNYTNVVKL